jgi:hypothetical protein
MNPPGPPVLHVTELEIRVGELIVRCRTCGATLPIRGSIAEPAVNRLLMGFHEVHPGGPPFWGRVPPYGRLDGQAVVLDAAGLPHTADEIAAALAQLRAQLAHHAATADPGADWAGDQLRIAIQVRERLLAQLWVTTMYGGS